MKTTRHHVILDKEEFSLIIDFLAKYNPLMQFVEKIVQKKELISTKEVVAKYCITRFTLYRLVNSGMLAPVYKYRTYYFDAEHTATFFKHYR